LAPKSEQEQLAAQLDALLRSLFTGKAMNPDEVYKVMGSAFAQSKKAGITKGQPKAEVVKQMHDLANTMLTSKMSASERNKVQAARVAYYAYREQHMGKKYAASKINKGSGFGWERKLRVAAGLPVTQPKATGEGSAGAGGSAKAGAPAGGRGGAAAGYATPKQQQKRNTQIADLARQNPAAFARTWNANNENQITEKQAATAIRKAQQTQAALKQGRDTYGPVGANARARGSRGGAQQRGYPSHGAELGKDAADYVKEAVSMDKSAAGAMYKGLEQIVTLGGVPERVLGNLNGPGGVGTGSQVEEYIARHPELNNAFVQGQLTRQQVASLIAKETQVKANAVTANVAGQGGRQLATGYRAPSLFGHNEAGQSYLQWLRAETRAPKPAVRPTARPAVSSENREAARTAGVKKKKPKKLDPRRPFA